MDPRLKLDGMAAALGVHLLQDSPPTLVNKIVVSHMIPQFPTFPQIYQCQNISLTETLYLQAPICELRTFDFAIDDQTPFCFYFL